MDAVSLSVRGTLPTGLRGRLVAVGPNTALSLDFRGGQTVSCRHRPIGADLVVVTVVRFGDSILLCGDCSPAHELSADLAVLRRVDLAGQSREVAANPKPDPVNGDLHLIATAESGAQSHVVVSAHALTRTDRPISASPSRILDLALTLEHVVFAGDGIVGIAARTGDLGVRWFATGVASPRLVVAHEVDGDVVVDALTPESERWVLHPGATIADRRVIESRNSAPVTVRLRPLTRAGSWTLAVRPGDEPSGTQLVVLDDADARTDVVAAVPLPHPVGDIHLGVWIDDLD
jgi:carotenoid cleavage dioxygenase-like enzyme